MSPFVLLRGKLIDRDLTAMPADRLPTAIAVNLQTAKRISKQIED